MIKSIESVGRSEFSGDKCDQKFLEVRQIGKIGRIGRSENLGG
jgi:hypothetical protein